MYMYKIYIEEYQLTDYKRFKEFIQFIRSSQFKDIKSIPNSIFINENDYTLIDKYLVRNDDDSIAVFKTKNELDKFIKEVKKEIRKVCFNLKEAFNLSNYNHQVNLYDLDLSDKFNSYNDYLLNLANLPTTYFVVLKILDKNDNIIDYTPRPLKFSLYDYNTINIEKNKKTYKEKKLYRDLKAKAVIDEIIDEDITDYIEPKYIKNINETNERKNSVCPWSNEKIPKKFHSKSWKDKAKTKHQYMVNKKHHIETFKPKDDNTFLNTLTQEPSENIDLTNI